MSFGSTPLSTTSLTGRRVVVVGGTSGMGLGAARAAAQAGAEVVVAGRRPLDARPQVEGAVEHALVDVTDERSVQELFTQVGELDHVFVTAAPSLGATPPFAQQDLATARRYVDEKLWGSWACARYAVPNMRSTGSITFLTGGIAVRPRAGMALATAGLAAVEGLSRALAVDLAPLRVNTIRPGLVDSDMWGFLDDAGRRELRARAERFMPVRRIGAIEDLGHAAVFLMTNGYVTGAILEVGGGETIVDTF